MSIGANISVVALGAILTFATHIHSAGFSVTAVGAILMLVGAIGLVMQIASLARQREMTAAQLEVDTAVVVRPNAATHMAPTPVTAQDLRGRPAAQNPAWDQSWPNS